MRSIPRVVSDAPLLAADEPEDQSVEHPDGSRRHGHRGPIVGQPAEKKARHEKNNHDSHRTQPELDIGQK